jgi:hypothetical protein
MPGHRPSPPIDVQIGLWWSGSRRGGLPVLSSSRTINAQPSPASLPPPFFFHSHAVPSLTLAGEIRRAPSTSIKSPAPVPPSPPLTTPTTHPKLPPRRRAHLRWQSETPRPPFSLHRHTATPTPPSAAPLRPFSARSKQPGKLPIASRLFPCARSHVPPRRRSRQKSRCRGSGSAAGMLRRASVRAKYICRCASSRYSFPW